MGEFKPVVRSFSSRRFRESIAHELGQPLRGMLWSVEILERYFQANPPAMGAIGGLPGMLKDEIKHLILLLNDLRSSKVLVDITLQPTSLSAEIKELLAAESVKYEQRGIRVKQDMPLGLPFIMADRDKVKQVISILCKNAAEAMPNGGTLSLRSYASKGWLCIDIADTGDVIPDAMGVFEPAMASKRKSGGLGLAIVREIVKQHKGRVSYTSQLTKGTTFHLRFPVRARQTVAKQLRSAAPSLMR